jgi:hypothetical protein
MGIAGAHGITAGRRRHHRNYQQRNGFARFYASIARQRLRAVHVPLFGIRLRRFQKRRHEELRREAGHESIGSFDLPSAGRQISHSWITGYEFLVELLEAMLAVWLLAQTPITSVAGRIGFVATAGILASLPTNVSYWNWYGFPGSYTASYMAIQIAGFIVAGIVAALVLRGRTTLSTDSLDRLHSQQVRV